MFKERQQQQPTGKHDGTICDAKPNGPIVHGATDNDARISTDANDAAAADGGTATSDYGANGAIVFLGAAAAIGLAESAAVGPVSTALSWIRNGITHGEELLIVRGERTGSF